MTLRPCGCGSGSTPGRCYDTFGLQLITKLKSNMNNRLLRRADKLLLRKRASIETVLGQLKSTPNIKE
jgi:hypothetical protein